MKIYNRTVSLFLAFWMIVSLALCASAAVVPDLTKTGSIRIYLTDSDDRAVSGGTLTIYKVGDVHEDDGNFSFVLTDDFAGSEESLEKINSASLAKRLADYADENRLTCETKTIGRDGRVVFDGLEPGLYLLVQYKAAYGYYKLDPFLVSIPQLSGDEYIYDVDASPKVEAEDKPTPPPPPPGDETEPDETEPKETEPEETEPDETEPKETEPEETEPDETEPDETEPEESEPDETEPDETEPTPDEPKLPQTGQLKWPIPILVFAGLVLFLAGWVMCFRKKDTHEE